MGNSKYLSNKNIEWHIVSPFLSIVSRLAHFICSIGTRLVIFAVEGGRVLSCHTTEGPAASYSHL